MSLKRITIEVLCETDVNDEYIIKNMKTGTYKALDRTPVYISAPKNVKSINVDVIDVGETDGQLKIIFPNN